MTSKTLPIIQEREADAKRIIERESLVWRVTKRDGVALLATRDYREDRINLEIEDGVVVGSYIG